MSVQVVVSAFSMEKVVRLITEPRPEEQQAIKAVLPEKLAGREALVDALAEVGDAFEELDDQALASFNDALIRLLSPRVPASLTGLEVLSPNGFSPLDVQEALPTDGDEFELLGLAIQGRLVGEQPWRNRDHSYAFFSPDEVDELREEVERFVEAHPDLDTDLRGELVGPLSEAAGRWVLVRRA